MTGPSFDDIFAVMAAVSLGDEARVAVPEAHDVDDPATKLGLALNVLLDDLACRGAEMSANEAHYRAMFADSPLSQWVCDVHTLAFVEVNEGAIRRYGYSREEFLKMTGSDLRPPEDVAAFLAEATNPLPANHTSVGRHQKKDGTILNVELRRQAISHNGKEAWPIIADDVTERTRAEEARAQVEAEHKKTLDALRLSEARFARLAESGIIGIVIADVTGNTLEANDAYLRMVGYSREDMLAGKLNWNERTPPEWRAVDERALEQLRKEGVASPWEKEMFRKDGSRVPVLLGVATLDYPQVITFVADLTDRKRTEQALARTEEQLRHSQKMEAVGRLAGGVAHDFNNVLSVILSYTALLLEGLRAGDPARDDLQEIAKAAQRAAGLTKQLLLFSRHQVFQPKVLDLNGVLVDMDQMLHRLVGEDVELFLSPGRALGRVKIDPSHVEQVVMNLVVNARDAMPTGGKITIETGNVMLSEEFVQKHFGVKVGPYVMLAVSDTGSGMDKTTQARIFEPFFTTKEIGKGTGLGLSTVFGIVQQSAGTIWVYSELGKGTSFKVYLPRVDEALDAVRVRATTAVMRGTETILLVEDEEQVRAVARSILRRNGYHVVEANNAGEALLLCESYDGVIHLLLTDIVMPNMSGPDLAQRLGKSRPAMRVLCMSGYTDDSVVKHGVVGPNMAFIQKPFTPESLTMRVRETLAGIT